VSSQSSQSTPRSFESAVRAALLALVVLAIVGFMVELLLIEHYDETWQVVPLVVLGAGLGAAIAVWRWPRQRTLEFFQGVMLAFVMAGILGVWRHYVGNAEFEIERHADLKGLALLWESVRGATPVLAPGALAQLGLLGLVYTFRHPALSRHHQQPKTPISEDLS